MDPAQLATETAAAAFLIKLGLVLLAGCAGGGLIALGIRGVLCITAARREALLRIAAARREIQRGAYGD